MPSILAEISFLSDSTDARKLQTPEYRQKIAEALYTGSHQVRERTERDKAGGTHQAADGRIIQEFQRSSHAQFARTTDSAPEFSMIFSSHVCVHSRL